MSTKFDPNRPSAIASAIGEKLNVLSYANTESDFRCQHRELVDNQANYWRNELLALRSPFLDAARTVGYTVETAQTVFDELYNACHNATLVGFRLRTKFGIGYERKVNENGTTWVMADGMPWADPNEPNRTNVEEAINRIIKSKNSYAAIAGHIVGSIPTTEAIDWVDQLFDRSPSLRPIVVLLRKGHPIPRKDIVKVSPSCRDKNTLVRYIRRINDTLSNALPPQEVVQVGSGPDKSYVLKNVA